MKNIYENYYRTGDGTYTPKIRLIVKNGDIQYLLLSVYDIIAAVTVKNLK